jgi:hypothetical protein
VDVPDIITAPDRFRFIGDSTDRDLPRPAIKYDDRVWYEWQLTNSNEASWVERCQWKPGDHLYVRETFRKYCKVDEYGYTHYDKEIIEFAADNPPMINEMDADGCLMFNKDGSEKFIPWRPSIHMNKEYARIWSRVTDVRVGRLQDISEEDAKAEGVEIITGGAFPYKHYGSSTASCANAIASFESLWREINGDESWDTNPWVWAINFKVLSTTGKPVISLTEKA